MKFGWCLVGLLFAVAQAISFEVVAKENPEPFCVREFVTESSSVLVGIISSGNLGDGQKLDMVITDNEGNTLSSTKNIVNEKNVAFDVRGPVGLNLCFTNQLTEGSLASPSKKRMVRLDFNVGADADDYSALQKNRNLEPVEAELHRAKDLVKEVRGRMDYQQQREMRFRDTNESTNSRVKNFAFLTTSAFVVLVGWQLLYLRSFFQRKHLIP
ncbi:COPII-coated vesicle component Erv25 [Schizosaccharomyces japonicus yFS275]|uniref:COPII-coated vesicle component Erv25 n=1 Tax=Schizosaccharomyces japonicus (strain yFS275 / FY16936) TaxID=402676 RepID=B6JVE9_SCHJY|nr:COPII-coated vesicle component Erv25 [Schizosaccharomyces japonicus yFS275]EEB05350.1 COPII-coated vesicle component Erv25 [Schizosaccharomyces japonicus yFS275]